MSLSTGMDRLTKDIRRAAQFRKAAIGDLCSAVKSTLAACATMRGGMARDYRAAAQEFLATLAKEIASHRRATMTNIAQLGSARRKTGSQMRSGLLRQVGAIMKQTRDLRAAAVQTVMSMAAGNHKMAAGQRASLGAGRRKLQTDMAGFLDALHADRLKAHGMWSTARFAGADRPGRR